MKKREPMHARVLGLFEHSKSRKKNKVTDTVKKPPAKEDAGSKRRGRWQDTYRN